MAYTIFGIMATGFTKCIFLGCSLELSASVDCADSHISHKNSPTAYPGHRPSREAYLQEYIDPYV